MSDPYLEQTRRAVALEDDAAAEQRIADRANQMREADERQRRHRELCAKHGLPETSTPRQVADAWIDHQNRWRSFVSCRFAGSATAAQILSPESAPPELRAEFQARQDRLRAEFEAQYDAEVSARPAASGPTVDDAQQGRAHNTTRMVA